MKKNKNIRRVLAAAMLLLFAFSIIPQKALHDMLGCHSKLTFTLQQVADESISAESFSCSCEQPVLQQAFLLDFIQASPYTYPSYCGERTIALSPKLHSRTPAFANLRGPPAES